MAEGGQDEQKKPLITPRHQTVSRLLSAQQTFEAPRYQRNYAWGADEIAAFLRDLEACIQRRLAGEERRHHFFGSVVTVDAPVPGSSRSNLQVVDGQQRLATFAMLVSQLKHALIRLAGSLPDGEKLKRTLEKRGDDLVGMYEVMDDEILLDNVEVRRVQLSSPDQGFFSALLDGGTPERERKSHRLMAEAYALIGEYVQGLVDDAADATAKAVRLHTLHEVLKSDWTIIHMAATVKADAYMLFQVLNDRGVGLTEGELLRSATLEAMEQSAGLEQINEVEEVWNEVLAGEPHVVRNAIGWLYASQIGQWPSRGTALEDYLLAFFPAVPKEGRPDQRAVGELVGQARSLVREFRAVQSLVAGDWPLPPHGAVTAWDKGRLRLLTRHLRYTDCLSLLVAATALAPSAFSRLVVVLERFAFRYHVVGEAPRDKAQAVLNRFAVEIRSAPEEFRVGALREELRRLTDRYVPDDEFRASVEQMRYVHGQGGNKPLKYLLMTIEDYHQWLDDNPQGEPVCRDKSRLLDFEGGTIEHIYAQHADDRDAALDALVDTLGNLTVLSGPENDRMGSKPFAQKRPLFAESTSTMNRQVGAKEDWTVEVIESRGRLLVDKAMIVFAI